MNEPNGQITPEKKKKSPLKIALTATACVLAAALLFGAGFFVSRMTLDGGLRSLLWFKERIQSEYYEEISDEDFWQAAIDGVEGILDDYSCFYTAEEYDEVVNADRGVKDGVGLAFFANTNKIYKVAVASPAFYAQSASGEKAEAGMYLTGVGENAESISDTFTASAVEAALSSAEEGDTLTLRLSATAADDTQNCIFLSVPFETYTESFVLYATNAATYAMIFAGDKGTWQEVGGGMDGLNDGEGYIRLVQFTGNAAEEFAAAAEQYKADGCDTLLLDLRNNGGGSLTVLQGIAAYLLKDADADSVVMYAGDGEDREAYRLKGDGYDGVFGGSEIYVAANGNTASASEALIGAMLYYNTVDYEDIYLVKAGGGDSPARTYGKGIMQTTWRNLLTGEAVKLTTARIYWPDGETCIYTLGIPEDGDGWIFRKNGAIVASSSSGRIIPGFRLDGGVPVFACVEYAEYVTGTVPEYYLVRDGEMSAISPGSPQETFYSVMSVNGTVYALSSDPDSGKAYFHEGDDRTELSYSGNGSIVPECLLTDGSSVYALAGVPEYGDDGPAREILWKDGEVLVAFEESFKVLACYPEEDRVLAVGYYGDDWGSQFMFLDGEYLPFPENYGLAAVSAGIMTAGHYCLCLNAFEISMPPLCILDGEIVEIDANGCFLGVGHTWEYVTDADAGHDDSSENV